MDSLDKRLKACWIQKSFDPTQLLELAATKRVESMLLSAAKAGSSEAQYWLALLDQPAIQAAQWLSVAAMTDSAYVASAQAALNHVSTFDQEQVKRQTSLWVHAHQLERQLPAFNEPIGLP